MSRNKDKKIKELVNNAAKHPTALEVQYNQQYLKGKYEEFFSDVSLDINDNGQNEDNDDKPKRKSKKSLETSNPINKTIKEKEDNKEKYISRIGFYFNKYPEMCKELNITQDDIDDLELRTYEQIKDTFNRIIKYRNTITLSKTVNYYVNLGEKVLKFSNVSVDGLSQFIMEHPETHQAIYEMADENEELTPRQAEHYIFPTDPKFKVFKSLASATLDLINRNTESEKTISVLSNNTPIVKKLQIDLNHNKYSHLD
jgi:hypothetical protein